VKTMDKFDQYMEQMKGLGPEQVRALIEDNKKKCICASCPTYNECAARKRELLYCLLGRSKECQMDELGCVCPDCPVTVDLDLVNTYYCTQGSEREMRRPKS
jgi:hypothetical protein